MTSMFKVQSLIAHQHNKQGSQPDKTAITKMLSTSAFLNNRFNLPDLDYFSEIKNCTP